MKSFVTMLGNYLLYFAVTTLAIFLYNAVADPILGWGQFGTGENISVQLFMILVAAILLSGVIYNIKYRHLKQTPKSFWGLSNFSKISLSVTVHMIIMGLMFTLFNAAIMKLLLTYNITSMNDFLEVYYNSVPFPILIVSAVVNTSLELILFIGIMFNEARKNVPVFWPILFIAVIIAALQAPAGIVMMLIGGALGILYGWVYIQISSIWPVILIGITFNVSLFSMRKIGWLDYIENFSAPTLIGLTVVSGLYLVFSALWYWCKSKKEQGIYLE
ncbi:CPBP family intramembrane glutamic endopeptidase [Niallia sp. XMNu-256]|uniref:CPBP family intramembrane glutamic endopeptidase n=1 Tax=Niallia sp. XMNu-256 TaxID=3082444 RepID=UPI0030D3D55A